MPPDTPEPRPPLRLEGEDESAASSPRPPSPVAPAPGASPPARPFRRPAPRFDEAGQPVVSDETLRERLDPASAARSRPGSYPPPKGWPLEALAYPLRGCGSLSLIAGAVVWAAADLLTLGNAFLGVLAKAVLVVGLLRWQVRAVAATATGEDRPPPFLSGRDFEPDALRGLLAVLVGTALYLVPAFVAWARPFLDGAGAAPRSAAAWTGIALLAGAALLVAPVLVLGAALSWRGIAWPWRAVVWLARGLVPCVATALSWAALVGIEALLPRFAGRPPESVLPLLLGLRAGALLFALVGARGLGVLGRAYEL